MRTILVVAFFAAGVSAASAQYNSRNSFGGYGTGSNSSSNSVQGHSNSDGSYTQPHQRTNPNNNTLDNYGTRGNYNPYTGQTGTRAPRF